MLNNTNFEETVFSENPEDDLWRELLQYTYEKNVERYGKEHSLNFSTETKNSIIGSFLQAYEYYHACNSVNLQIEPLLLYYGTANLLWGMCNLITGNLNKIENHGMKINVESNFKYIADAKVHFNNITNGGIHVYAKIIGYTEKLVEYNDWKLMDSFASIAEIEKDFKKCYSKKSSNVIMLEVFNTPDGKVEKIYYNEENKETIVNLLKDVIGFNESYLPYQFGEEKNNGKKCIILRHKLNSHDITKISYSGQPYLYAAIRKNSKKVEMPTILNMYISLFVLGSLCRYFPEKWSPFVISDTTGEKLLVDKFLRYAKRLIPNYILNIILSKNIQYVSNKYNSIDTVKLVGEHQVRELVKKEVRSGIKSLK